MKAWKQKRVKGSSHRDPLRMIKIYKLKKAVFRADRVI